MCQIQSQRFLPHKLRRIWCSTNLINCNRWRREPHHMWRVKTLVNQSSPHLIPVQCRPKDSTSTRQFRTSQVQVHLDDKKWRSGSGDPAAPLSLNPAGRWSINKMCVQVSPDTF
mmetsp:Transcript_56450/g.103223  ORF Transcript_56450/g.103223 Transcript_56450/m.103223 type:complete len:114 (+) Transcript_56450:235-576(+)